MASHRSNLEAWIESVSSLDGYSFGIADYSEMFKIGRSYKKLLEQRECNEHRLKAARYEQVIEQIKRITDGSAKQK